MTDASAYQWAFPLTEEQEDSLIEKCVISLDTNVILNLYSLHAETLSEVLSLFEKVKERVWISDQVAREFFKNRVSVIRKFKSNMNSIMIDLRKEMANVNKFMTTLKNRDLIDPNIIDNVVSQIENSMKTVEDAISAKVDSETVSEKNDKIFYAIKDMLFSNIGTEFSEFELEEQKKIAQKRNEKKIPPGYRDKDKKDLGNFEPFGDYFVWRQMMNKSRDDNCDILFVTAERKTDWWDDYEGFRVGPRSELLKEFYTETKNRVLIFSLKDFMKKSKIFGVNISSKSMENVEYIKADCEEVGKISVLSFVKYEEFVDISLNLESQGRLFARNIIADDLSAEIFGECRMTEEEVVSTPSSVSPEDISVVIRPSDDSCMVISLFSSDKDDITDEILPSGNYVVRCRLM
ncbi:PIN-like domain-containing protein [Acetobacter nitrogenifigens]|nr:PIN-like domain-containing protein [Acetobacter nitrogenifigens]